MFRNIIGRARLALTGATARRVLLVVSVVAAVAVVVRNADAIEVALHQVGSVRVGFAILLAAASTVAGAEGWRVLLFDSTRLSDVSGAWSTYLVSNLGKYVPGAVWPVLMQREYAARYGRTMSQVSVAFLQSIAFGVVSATAIGLLSLPMLPWTTSALFLPVAVVVTAIVVVLARPDIVGATLHVLGRAVGWDLSPHCGAPGRARRSMALLALGWLLSGTAFHLLLEPLGRPGQVSLLTSVGGYAVGAGAGVLVAVLPGGVGSREIALALMFSRVVDHDQLIPLLVVARALTTVSEILCAAVAAGVRTFRTTDVRL